MRALLLVSVLALTGCVTAGPEEPHAAPDADALAPIAQEMTSRLGAGTDLPIWRRD